jgi:hypothetical protein
MEGSKDYPPNFAALRLGPFIGRLDHRPGPRSDVQPLRRLVLALLVGGHGAVALCELAAGHVRPSEVVEEPADPPPPDDAAQTLVTSSSTVIVGSLVMGSLEYV